MTRTFRRLPAQRDVEAALRWCEEHGMGTPVLHRCDSELVVGYVETTPRPVHELVREAEQEGRL